MVRRKKEKKNEKTEEKKNRGHTNRNASHAILSSSTAPKVRLLKVEDLAQYLAEGTWTAVFRMQQLDRKKRNQERNRFSGFGNKQLDCRFQCLVN